ncbi:hypothetical protein OAD67_00345 [bacterium]|nr:hypothetical protein [bacterium]
MSTADMTSARGLDSASPEHSRTDAAVRTAGKYCARRGKCVGPERLLP